MLLQKKEFYVRPFLPEGSMIMALVITMLFFSALVVAMLSTMGSSVFNQLNTAATTKATYIAKSGYNYLASNYKSATTEATKNSVLETLQGITFALLNNAGSFVLTVQPYYLRSQATLTIDTTNNLTLLVRFPGAVSYTIPSSATDKAMAVYTSNASHWRRFYYTTVTGSAPNYTLHLSNTNPPDGTINVIPGTGIVPVILTTASAQTLASGGNLNVAAGTCSIFPARFGFFEVPGVAALSSYVFYYDHCTSGTPDTFFGIRDANNPTAPFPSTTGNIPATTSIYAHTSAAITSTGTFNTGSGLAVTPVSNTFSRMAILGYTVGGNSTNAPPYNYSITGTGGFTPLGTGVTVNATTITLGNTTANTGGVAWYAGNSDAAYCVNGICNFGGGIRAYFTFADSSTNASHGDGFTFTIMNGANNDISRRGGMPAITGMGELMAYAGPGNTVAGATVPLANTLDGLGLAPPKMAIEFDKYTNANVSGAGCNNGRSDAANNHMALMLWGANTAGNCAAGTTLAGYLAASCDDNIHGAGTAGDPDYPQNSLTGTPSPACLTDPTQVVCGYDDLGSTTYLNTTASHTFRIEVTRNQTANLDTNFNYNVQAWIDCTTCNDVTVHYTTSTPQINRTIELSLDKHTKFNTMLFGFTQSTGTAIQNITISNFAIYFTPPN